jgi:hypothetical protein
MVLGRDPHNLDASVRALLFTRASAQLGRVAVDQVLRAAAEALAAGHGGPALVRLAARWPHDPLDETIVMLDDALRELGLATTDMVEDDAVVFVCRAVSDAFLDGRLSGLDFATVGYDLTAWRGPDEFMGLDAQLIEHRNGTGPSPDVVAFAQNWLDEHADPSHRWRPTGSPTPGNTTH